MPYSKGSVVISEYIAKEMNYDEEKKVILAYALDVLFLTVLGFVILIIAGYLLGITFQVLTATIAGASLRLSSGGAHSSSRLRCMIIGTIQYTIVGLCMTNIYKLLVGQTLLYILIITMSLLSLIIVCKYAPVDSPAKPILSVKFRKRLRKAAIIITLNYSVISIISINTIWGITIMGGLMIQAISLLPIFHLKEVTS
jgi:accessory gene regulator B